MKYIITFEDEPNMMEDGIAFYRCKEAPWWSGSDHIIGKLKPYDYEEPPEEFKIGDEVTYGKGEYMETFVITRFYNGNVEGVTTVATDYFEIGEANYCAEHDAKKTGRHFNLPWMEGEHEEA